MANRSYLYASDHLSGSAAWERQKDLRSIAEWRYDIPFVFRIRLSGNPTPVRSFFRRLLGNRRRSWREDPLMPFYEIGLGAWSNVLYFQFGEEEGRPPVEVTRP